MPVDVSYSQNYRVISAQAILVAGRPGYFDLVVVSDEEDPCETLRSPSRAPQELQVRTIKRVVECRLLLAPQTAKGVLELWAQRIAMYEEQWGEIPMKPLQQKTPVQDPRVT